MRSLLIACVLFLVLLNTSSCSSESEKQVKRLNPLAKNVLVILVDDLGWKDVGYQGSSFYQTPNIDQLAKDSVAFSQAYSSSPVCSPARAALMTGKNPARLHITNWIPGQQPSDKVLLEPKIKNRLPLNEISLAESFRDAGYKTFFAGKWHLGNEGAFPEDQGFEINLGGHHRGKPPKGYYSPYQIPNLSEGPEGEYLPDRLTNETISFIEQAENTPFFAMLSYYTVHTPIHTAKAYQAKFELKGSSNDVSGQLTERLERNGRTKLVQDNVDYASMVYGMDHNIGLLLQRLEELGRLKDTAIVFTSDNGGLSTLDPTHSIYSHGIPTSNSPLRAGKGWLYEGGIKIPLLIKAPGLESRVDNTPVITTDLFSTVLSLTGLQSAGENDGKSLTPLLKGMDEFDERELIWHFPHYHGSASVPSSAIRKGAWKYLYFYETGKGELYNLNNDQGERTDEFAANPELVADLHERLFSGLRKLGADMPIFRIN